MEIRLNILIFNIKVIIFKKIEYNFLLINLLLIKMEFTVNEFIIINIKDSFQKKSTRLKNMFKIGRFSKIFFKINTNYL